MKNTFIILNEGKKLDVIASIDGVPVSGPGDISGIVLAHKPRQVVTVVYTDPSGVSRTASVVPTNQAAPAVSRDRQEVRVRLTENPQPFDRVHPHPDRPRRLQRRPCQPLVSLAPETV